MECDRGSVEVKPEQDCEERSSSVMTSTMECLDAENEPEAESMELAKEDLIREFDILDEFGGENEENAENSSLCSTNGDDEMDNHSDFQDESDEERSNTQGSKSKKIFEVQDIDSEKPLPPGWVKITHESGIPVYLHKETRVCMATRPYFIGADSVRKHKIPASCVPCLDYDKLRAEYLQNSKEGSEDNEEGQLMKSDMLSRYCQKLFRFKTIRVLRFNTWADRRLFTKSRMLSKQDPKAALSLGARIVKIPVNDPNDPTAESKDFKRRGWILNPNGKSYVCLLHEYVQHALKKHPSYVFSELENAKTPYSAAVVIDGMQYGVGFGSSKKQAKLEAAKATLEVLIPDLHDKINVDNKTGQSAPRMPPAPDISIFDDVKIEDPRVADLCARTAEPYPHAVLLSCIKRNFGLGEADIKYEDRAITGGEHEFTIKVGQYSAVVKCQNKRHGKQRTAQAILKQLHPHIDSWGSLLRMYGNCSVKTVKKKREKKREQVFIEPPEPDNDENTSILSRLNTVMSKEEESCTELPQYCHRIKEIEELIKLKCPTSTTEPRTSDQAAVDSVVVVPDAEEAGSRDPLIENMVPPVDGSVETLSRACDLQGDERSQPVT